MSVALVGPTLAMSGNGQGLIATVGKAIPLVFLIGLVGVSLVGYSFVRLTRHLNHAGSAYGLVGGTIGPRAGFFSGFAMLGAYVGFSIGTLALTAAFTNAFIAELQPDNENPYQVPWLAGRRDRRRHLVPARPAATSGCWPRSCWSSRASASCRWSCSSW